MVMTGEGEVDVVEARGPYLVVDRLDAGVLDCQHEPGEVSGAVADGNTGTVAVKGCPERAELQGKLPGLVGGRQGELGVTAAGRALSSAGVPLAMTRPPVDEGDPLGQGVGFVEVLRGQQHRGAVLDEPADDVPERVAAGRIESGRGLVEEEDVGAGAPGGRAG